MGNEQYIMKFCFKSGGNKHFKDQATFDKNFKRHGHYLQIGNINIQGPISSADHHKIK